MPDPTTTEILQSIGAFDARLDHLEKSLDRLNKAGAEAEARTAAALKANADTMRANAAALATLSKPFWKRPTFLGGAFAVVAFVVGWFLSAYNEESPFPAFVHRNLLMTEPAIARTLRLARNDESYKSTAFDAIGEVVADQVTRDGQTRAELVDMAFEHGARTYNGAKTFFPTELKSLGLACLLALDAEFVAAIGARPAALRSLCARPPEAQVAVSIPFIETSPLHVPFAAGNGDTVTLFVTVVATSQSNPDQELRAPLQAVNVRMDARATPLDMPPLGDAKRSRVTLKIEDDEPIHYFSIELSDRGLELVGLSDRPVGARAVQDVYSINISATVIVEPKP